MLIIQPVIFSIHTFKIEVLARQIYFKNVEESYFVIGRKQDLFTRAEILGRRLNEDIYIYARL